MSTIENNISKRLHRISCPIRSSVKSFFILIMCYAVTSQLSFHLPLFSLISAMIVLLTQSSAIETHNPISPIGVNLTKIYASGIRTAHMPIITLYSDHLLSPAPFKIPTEMVAVPRQGSANACTRRTIAPIAITCASSIKMDISCGANMNKSVAVTAIAANPNRMLPFA